MALKEHAIRDGVVAIYTDDPSYLEKSTAQYLGTVWASEAGPEKIDGIPNVAHANRQIVAFPIAAVHSWNGEGCEGWDWPALAFDPVAGRSQCERRARTLLSGLSQGELGKLADVLVPKFTLSEQLEGNSDTPSG